MLGRFACAAPLRRSSRAVAPLCRRAFAGEPEFSYTALFQEATPDPTEYRLLTADFVSTIEVSPARTPGAPRARLCATRAPLRRSQSCLRVCEPAPSSFASHRAFCQRGWQVDGKKVLKVEPEALSLLASTAMRDIAHLLRPAHLKQLASILDVRPRLPPLRSPWSPRYLEGRGSAVAPTNAFSACALVLCDVPGP